MPCKQTDRHTYRVTTEGTLSGFQDFFLQPIIKDRPNIVDIKQYPQHHSLSKDEQHPVNILGCLINLRLEDFRFN